MSSESEYKDDLFIKLANPARRVQAIRFESGWLFSFKTLEGYKDIRTTHLKLSNEAVRGLVAILAILAQREPL